MKSWGKDVIPKEQWIDPEKQYRTRDGRRVDHIVINLYNTCGEEVTYPVKGVIVEREDPYKSTFNVWSLDGLDNIVWPDDPNFRKNDLIEIKE